MADIKLFDTEEYKEAEKKRKESEDVKGPKANRYSHASTEALVSGKPSVGTAITDTVIDAIPTVALAVGGHITKNSKGYKGAKLRDYAKNTEYKSGDPDLLAYAEGTVIDPSGPLSRPIRNLYGKPEEKKLQKKAEKAVKKVVADKIKEDKVSLVDAGVLKRGGPLPKTLAKKAEDIIEEAIPLVGDATSAKSVVDKNIKLINTGNSVKTKKVEIPKGDKVRMAAPTVLNTLAVASGTQNALNTGLKFRDLRQMDKGGVQSTSPFFTVTELLDGLTNESWRYNKKEAIAAMNKIWDDVMENGTPSQQKEMVEIYNSTDFNKKSSVIPSLKYALRLVNKD